MDSDYNRDNHPKYLKRKAQWGSAPADNTQTEANKADKRPTYDIEVALDENPKRELTQRVFSALARDAKTAAKTPAEIYKQADRAKEYKNKAESIRRTIDKDSAELAERKKRTNNTSALSRAGINTKRK